MSQSQLRVHIFDLPQAMIYEILLRLAQIHYDSLDELAKTCHYFKNCCQEFMEKHPRQLFIKPLREDDSDSFDSDCSGNYNYDELDDLDILNNELDDLSYGSNYPDDEDDDLSPYESEPVHPL